MTVIGTTIRATHLLSNAAWFGGSLMGAVGLNPAARRAGGEQDRIEVESAGWERWGPVQGAAIGAHVLSGIAIVVDNRRRVTLHSPTRTASVVKTALTGLALAASYAAYTSGERVGEPGQVPEEQRREDRRRLTWLQWMTPLTTGGLLVLDSYIGEQQRGLAGLLDRPTRP